MAPTRPSKKNKKQQQATDAKKMDPKVLLEAASAKLEEGDLENALGAATAALQATGPGGELELLCTNMIGQIYVEAGEIDDARAAFTRAVALDSDGSADEARGGGPEKFLWLAQLSEDGGQDSVRWFERGAAALRAQIRALDETAGRRTAEQEALLEARKRRLAGTLCGVAEVYMTDLSWEADAEQRCEALVTEATLVAAEVYMTDLSWEADAEQRCEALVTEATLVAPGLAEAWQTVANVRISQHKTDEARAALARSLDIWRGLPVTHPDVPDFPTRVSLARLLLEVDMEEESIEVLEKLVGDDDESVEAWYLGGWGQYISGDKLKQAEAEGTKSTTTTTTTTAAAGADEDDDWRAVWRSARQWLTVCLKLYEQQEYEDEKLGEHARQLLEAITKELGPAAENEADEVWEDDSDDEEEDQEMAG
ncbi:assembly chaperone of rpl4 like protein [Verticillium longisporum]|uniref:Assembly chaperone of rpl4 like protein n=1 Tax=Verticillium longisporum TaxID=100787 RepID=A0A8I2ZPI7_VERLO|nr:assembly chaperone of rpl4 like protein [Verticillium longisporum]